MGNIGHAKYLGMINIVGTMSILRTLQRKVISHIRKKEPLPLQLRMVRLFQKGEQIPSQTPSPNYCLVRFCEGMESDWVQLIDSSSEFGNFNFEDLLREMLSGLLPQGGIFVTENHRLVACAAACYRKKYDPFALLMYVLVLPEHRGRGLGKLVSTEAMQVARLHGYPGMILHTDDFRLAAIKTYMKLGFAPDIVDSNHRQRWQVILDSLAHERKR